MRRHHLRRGQPVLKRWTQTAEITYSKKSQGLKKGNCGFGAVQRPPPELDSSISSIETRDLGHHGLVFPSPGDADPGAPSGDRDGRLWLERKERNREGGRVPDVLGAQLTAVPDSLPWDVSAKRDATAEHSK